MFEGKEITGTYGRSMTETTIFVYNGWYVCEGSKNVNLTDDDDLINGVDVEELHDYDVFTSNKSIESLEDLIKQVDELENF